MHDSWYDAPMPPRRGEWDCVRCGEYVGVKINPLDASDPRPLHYDCAIREREERQADTARAVVGLACDGWTSEQIAAFYWMREERRRRELAGENGGEK